MNRRPIFSTIIVLIFDNLLSPTSFTSRKHALQERMNLLNLITLARNLLTNSPFLWSRGISEVSIKPSSYV